MLCLFFFFPFGIAESLSINYSNNNVRMPPNKRFNLKKVKPEHKRRRGDVKQGEYDKIREANLRVISGVMTFKQCSAYAALERCLQSLDDEINDPLGSNPDSGLDEDKKNAIIAAFAESFKDVVSKVPREAELTGQHSFSSCEDISKLFVFDPVLTGLDCKIESPDLYVLADSKNLNTRPRPSERQSLTQYSQQLLDSF